MVIPSFSSYNYYSLALTIQFLEVLFYIEFLVNLDYWVINYSL